MKNLRTSTCQGVDRLVRFTPENSAPWGAGTQLDCFGDTTEAGLTNCEALDLTTFAGNLNCIDNYSCGNLAIGSPDVQPASIVCSAYSCSVSHDIRTAPNILSHLRARELSKMNLLFSVFFCDNCLILSDCIICSYLCPYYANRVPPFMEIPPASIVVPVKYVVHTRPSVCLHLFVFRLCVFSQH